MRGAGDGSARRSVVPRRERWRSRGHRGARQVDSEPAASAVLRAGASASAPVRCRRARRHVHAGQPGHRTHPANGEVAVRRRTDALGPRGAPPRSAITLSAVPQPRLTMPAYYRSLPILHFSSPNPLGIGQQFPLTPECTISRLDFARIRAVRAPNHGDSAVVVGLGGNSWGLVTLLYNLSPLRLRRVAWPVRQEHCLCRACNRA